MKKSHGFPSLLLSALAGALLCAFVFAAVFYFKFADDRAKLAATAKFASVYDTIDDRYIADADMEKVSDAAYSAMVEAIGDRWSYYMTSDEYDVYKQYQSNSYTGIGVSVVLDSESSYMKISGVTEDSPASRAGVSIGDLLISFDGESLQGKTATELKGLISSKNGESFNLGLLSTDGNETTVVISSELVKTPPVKYEMLDGEIGYVKIKNFETDCGNGIISAVDGLISQGAKGIIFDVRNNPGGKLSELLTALDHLLPEGKMFISVDESGKETISYSDAECVDIPMAVLVNANTYSAAEFFAEGLSEYGLATVAGSNTTGKSRSQISIVLSDGSAVHISTNRYLTPNGIDLAEQGGITPDTVVDLNDEDAAYLAAGQLAHSDDEQLQAVLSKFNTAS